MSSKVLGKTVGTPPGSELPPTIQTWTRLLHAHASVTQQVGRKLLAAHGLSMKDYVTLDVLSRAPGQRMRRIDLARRVLLTPSGVTRLLGKLARAGLVERTGNAADLRVAYAHLTFVGADKLEAASGDYADAIHELLERHLSAAELRQLGDLLGKLAGTA